MKKVDLVNQGVGQHSAACGLGGVVVKQTCDSNHNCGRKQRIF
jgi:hypothetical protein